MATLRDLDHSLPLQLLKAREAAMAKFRPMLKRHGLTEQQWRVIRVLAAFEDIDATTLAQRSKLLPPSLTRILRYLEGQQMVARRADEQDQRRATFALTGQGRAKFDEVGPDSEQLYAHIEKEFGADNLTRLYTLLADFNQAMSSQVQTRPGTPD